MDYLRARQLARTFLPRDGQTLDAASGRIDPAAIRTIDQNRDAHISREELAAGLAHDQVNVDVSGTTIIDANTVAFPEMTGPLGPNGRVEDLPWFRGGMIATGLGNGPITPERPNTLATPQLYSLVGQDFDDVAKVVRTPDDTATFLNRMFAYDHQRGDYGTGPAPAYSSAEMLQSYSGVCRDQHAVARDLLKANGYQAELMAYRNQNHNHAVTAYQDPVSGLWGVIEYGSVYAPEKVQARSPEEAIEKIRPDALMIERFTADGPDERSRETRLQYTRLMRTYATFMTGPAPGVGSGAQVDRSGVTVNLAGPADSHLQAQFKIVADPEQPQTQGSTLGGVWQSYPDVAGYLRLGLGGGMAPQITSLDVGSNVASANPLGIGFVQFEERHPALLRLTDIGSTGITANFSSRISANAVALEAIAGEDAANGRRYLADMTANPEFSLSRSFAIGSDRPNLQVRLTTGAGYDMTVAKFARQDMMASPVVSTYTTATVNARPLPDLGLQLSGYVPFTSATNDYLASPALKATVATPWATVGGTVSVERATTSVQVGTQLERTRLTAYATTDTDLRSNQTTGNLGIQASVSTW